MSKFKTECRKFQPNIFNKTKCSNCFRQREEHSAEALECNRACRKVSKCGYLFVAPDWDFSNPLNRTKRWQRRWFVLFDDGELTYSVDDLPATIPQGVIDMNRVLEVTEAEDITGNQFSLAITSPDRITFVKGTCKEETRWWLEVLSVFPRTQKQHGRHKRNATFPGIKSSSVLQQTRTALVRAPSTALSSSFDPSAQRARFSSCIQDSLNIGRPSSAPTLGGQDDEFLMKETSMVVGSSPPPTYSQPTPIYHSTPMSSLPPNSRLMSDEHKENTPPYLQDYYDHPPTSESPPTQDKVVGHRPRTRRTAKREARGLTYPRNDASHQLIISELEESRREEKLKDIADSITRARRSSSVGYLNENGVKPTREKDSEESVKNLPHSVSESVVFSTGANIRGDPDGCGVVDSGPHSFSSLSDIQRVDLPAEDVLYIKKGWLLKQGLNKDWNKHWFVLQGNGLRFYRDPSAEDNGILDGIIDLGMVKDIEEKEVGRNYGFTIITWEDKKYTFSAVTCGIRSNWVQALRNAANLKEKPNVPLTLGEKIEKEIIANKDLLSSAYSSLETNCDVKNLSVTSHGRSFVSSDDEYKTASDASFFRDASREDLTNYDRLRSRSASKGLMTSTVKRSRSSPPSSRRGTRDDFPSFTTKLSDHPSSSSNLSDVPFTGSKLSDVSTSVLNDGQNSVSKLSDSVVSGFSETDSVQSVNEYNKHRISEKEARTGESVLVDLLETQVESLKAKLEQTQESYLEMHKENSDLKDRLSSLESSINLESSSSRTGSENFDPEIKTNGFEMFSQFHPPSMKEKALSTFDIQRQTISSLSSEVSSLRKRLQVYEEDLDMSEREADRLKTDKKELCAEADKLKVQVKSLEQQIDDVHRRLEKQDKEIKAKNIIISELESLNKQYQKEHREWQDRVSIEDKKFKELKSAQTQHGEIVRRLTRSLEEAEMKVAALSHEKRMAVSGTGLSGSHSEEEGIEWLRQENSQLNAKVSQLTLEIGRLKNNLKSEKSEAYKWKDLVKELRSLLDGRNEEMDCKKSELDLLRDKLKATQSQLDTTADKLFQGIEENESLCNRVRELESQISQGKIRHVSSAQLISHSKERFSASRKNLLRLRSLSDLTNFDMNIEPEELERERLVEEYLDLRLRFEKAVNEIRALKQEVRDAQSAQDEFELTSQCLKSEMKTKEEEFYSEINLMSSRIQDMTNKYSNSEKQVRTLKQKMSRAESRERRRTQSLKGRESFALSKDMEVKLSELECKVDSLLRCEREGASEVIKENKDSNSSKIAKRSKSFEESTRSSRLRRKSLDGQSSNDAVRSIVRINELEEKVASLSGEDLKKITLSNAALGTSSNNSSASNIASSQGQLTASSSSLHVTGRSKSPTLIASPLRSPLRSPATPHKAVRSPRLTPEKFSKLSRSESEPKILREKLNALEKILTVLQAKLNESMNLADALQYTCPCGGTTFSRLHKSLMSTLHLAQSRGTSSRDQVAVNRLQPLTLRLHELLKEKISQLLERRHHLKTAGKWTRDAQLKCFAERLAFETLILSQIAQAVQAAQRTESYEASLKLQDIVEAHRKLSFLEKKLTNPDFDMEPMTPLEFYTSLLAEKLVVEGDVINSVSTVHSQKSSSSHVVNETCRDLQKKLLERERTLANLITQYKEEKLYEIAVVMARETVTGTQPAHDDSVLLEELRLREAWTIAQDFVTQELVNMEASKSILRLGHLFGSNKEQDPQLTIQINEASMDKLQTGAEESLRQEIEESVFTLSNKYEEVLGEYRGGNTGIINSVSASMEAVLTEFASVIAQKAIIDGQLVVATGDENHSSVSDPLTIVEEKTDPVDSATDVVASEAHLLMFLGGGDPVIESMVHSAMTQAEFSFIYKKMTGQTTTEVSNLLSSFAKEQLSIKSQSFSSSDRDVDTDPLHVGSKIPPSPKNRRRSEVSRKSRRVSDITGMVVEGCRQCEELRQELSHLKKCIESKRILKQETECQKCIDYVHTIKHLEEDHRNAMEALQSQHQAEIDRLRDQVKYDPPTRDSDDELTELKRRLCLLEEGYESQIAALKKQYQEALGSQSDVCEENIRQRYQLEIEHLRELCEKGLNAMESSHRRLIMELEEKHEREMAALQAEKEEALAEETQATLAALDAMRKAHEAEVQKEVTKFKEEFLRRMESGREEMNTHSRLHEDELREVRQEILALSEKYSGKCLEMAAKEQRLDSLQRQLAESKDHSRSLEERNRQLKQRLHVQIASFKTEPFKSSSDLLRQHECELALKDEEIAKLGQMLQKSKMHESDLGQLCGQLNQYFRSERALRTGQQTLALREKLEKITISSLKDDTRGASKCFSSQESERLTVDSHTGKAVSRSPSCPGLVGISKLWNTSATFGDSENSKPPLGSSPLLGMVALRKKVFEGPPTTKSEC